MYEGNYEMHSTVTELFSYFEILKTFVNIVF